MHCKKNIIVKKKILAYYKINKRDLPWRTKQDNNQNPYFTLVSEIMLQQTQVNTVLDYYKKFIKKWPTVNSLAKANIEDVLTMWSGLGYYSRAKNLLQAAKIISFKYNGNIPNKFKDLICLPGIGEYTASAIISFAYGEFAVVLDTNIKRFLTRIFGLKKSDILYKNKLNNIGEKFFSKSNSGKLAQAIMDFSSDICKKKNPSCFKCPLEDYCKYDEFLEINHERKIVKKKYTFVFFYLLKDKYFFLRKRDLSKSLGGMYEVPGTQWKCKTWPTLPLKFKYLDTLPKVISYKLSNTDLQTRIYKVNIKNKASIKEEGIWVRSSELEKIPLSILTKKILNYCINYK